MSTSSRSDDRSTSYAGDAVAPASAPAQEQVSDQEFEALLIDMLEPAYRLGFRLTNDKQDAEDLVQEAALRAFRFRHTFQRGSSFKAWFYRIVINQFYTGTRRKRNTTTSLDEQMLITTGYQVAGSSMSSVASLRMTISPSAAPRVSPE